MMSAKHVFILGILILPLFILAPAMVPRMNETQDNLTHVDAATPAQFAQETLRVAVYAESNTTLPSYADGGVYTSHYANVIAMLEDQGHAVTALSTQDILDYELMTVDYDVFVLPDQLPREEIVNLVKDYWLAGGGILSFNGAFGFLLYAGMIHPSIEGYFGLVGYSPGDSYWWNIPYTNNINVTERYPVTKAYQVDDILLFGDNATVWNTGDLTLMIGDSVHTLAIDGESSGNGAVGAFDNPSRGGRIVQIPGNCSSFTSWQIQIAADAVDWLAPRAKGKVLVDLTHGPYIPVDSWDPWIENYVMNQWRNGLVNRSYTVDKLHTDLTFNNLAPYDMLVIPMPTLNFTSQEVQDVRTWILNGGGLFLIGDIPGLGPMDGNLNYLLSPYDITFNLTLSGGGFDSVATYADAHPTHEACSQMEFDAFGFLNITGDAYPLWMYLGNIAAAGQDFGDGRIIVISDGNLCTDFLGILDRDNFEYLMNAANWLTAATADVLVYTDEPNSYSSLVTPVAKALNDLGIKYYVTSDASYLNLSLYAGTWAMVIVDNPWFSIGSYYQDLADYVDGGGRFIMSGYQVDSNPASPLWASLGFEFAHEAPNSFPMHIWSPAHGIFNLPASYSASNFTPTLDYGDEGDLVTVTEGAALAGWIATPAAGNATIVLSNNGRTLYNAYLIDQFAGDLDDSTYADNWELWENEIAFVYYARPTIDHPSDISYMETETGNEITWSPIAPAGAWEYVLSVNGTPLAATHWSGGNITVNVDGLNASSTEYQLTVYDRLGYSASDLVVLNVTEYVAPGPFGIDPLLIAAIVGGIAAVIVVIVIVMKKKSK